MQVFQSPAGDGTIFFENLVSPRGTPVAYDPAKHRFVLDAPFCGNRGAIQCNWAAAVERDLCPSCAMTAIAPDPSVPGAMDKWAKTELAKRWVLDALGRWGWFGKDDSGAAPVFHMLAEGADPVVMGHEDGTVTISIEESDPVMGVQRREALSERYRTMIGHMRHELAHMLWWRLSVVPGFLDAFRTMFGDERADYGEALKTHYSDGPPADWQQSYLTAYASSHPHEDWAETTAHLLHLVDIADSFRAMRFSAPDMPGPDWDPYGERDLTTLLDAAATIAIGVNHVNRSMGLPDAYPFVMTETTRGKLGFVHRWLSGEEG